MTFTASGQSSVCLRGAARSGHAGPRLGRRSRRGVTLIELVVVILVIALLAALVAPQVFGRASDARIAAAKAQVALFATALDGYRLDNGAYPTTAQGLDALRAKPGIAPVPGNWRGPYLRQAVPLDPWGRPYQYLSPGSRNPGGFDLVSLGRDGQPGGEGEDADVVGQ